MEKKVLNLVLKHKWYDMIASGEKTEEYREIKPYWWKRLVDKVVTLEFFDYQYVRFHRGYTSQTMTFGVEKITVGVGNPAWGAPNKQVFIIKLGKREEEQS